MSIKATVAVAIMLLFTLDAIAQGENPRRKSRATARRVAPNRGAPVRASGRRTPSRTAAPVAQESRRVSRRTPPDKTARHRDSGRASRAGHSRRTDLGRTGHSRRDNLGTRYWGGTGSQWYNGQYARPTRRRWGPSVYHKVWVPPYMIGIFGQITIIPGHFEVHDQRCFPVHKRQFISDRFIIRIG